MRCILTSTVLKTVYCDTKNEGRYDVNYGRLILWKLVR